MKVVIHNHLPKRTRDATPFKESEHPREKGGKFAMSSSHPSGKGPKYSATANSHEEVSQKMSSLRKSNPEHQVMVHNQHSGMVHTFKPGENYNKNYVD